jgi:hypothetical protein
MFFPHSASLNKGIYHIVGRYFVYLVDISPSALLPFIVSHRLSPRLYFEIYGYRDLAAAPKTVDNPLATHFPDIIKIKIHFLVTNL